ncbi:hypothetical protein A2U01_0071687, partial [Trifolium medium]|nr:hypothetical protein [Trifolium medium]
MCLFTLKMAQPSGDMYFTEAGLIKTVMDLRNCYERLVKEFLVNIDEECNDPTSSEYRKV